MDLFRPELEALAAYHTPQVPGADKLNENEWPEDLPDGFKQKLAHLLTVQIPGNRYPPSAPDSLRNRIAEYCGVNPEMVSFGNGSDELIRSVIMATCLGNGGTVLTVEPTFSMYRILSQTLGVPCVVLERNEEDFSLDLDQIRRAVASAGVRVLFLANPNSPTGTLLDEEVLLALLALPVLVVLDEAYHEFSGYSAVPLLAKYPNLIVLRTFSKAFRLASFRVGYAIARPEAALTLEKVRLPYNLSALSQLAATLALEHKQELLAGIPALLDQRDRVARALADTGQFRLWPSATNFIYARPFSRSSEDVRLALAERGTLVRATGGGLRISAGTPTQNDRLLAHLRELFRLGSALAEV